MNPIDTRLWAQRRRLMYLIGAGSVVVLILGLVYVAFFYTPPNCFDGWKNGGELGVDCGGTCERACTVSVDPPRVLWTRAFRVAEGQYNAVAYVENRNSAVGVKALNYRFVFYDEQGAELTAVDGVTTLPPYNVFPIFSSRINLGNLSPARVALEIDPNADWVRMDDRRDQFKVESTLLKSADFEPRLEASIRNQSLDTAYGVEAVATIFDANRNPLTSSAIRVDEIAGGEARKVTFTWPEPIAKTLRSCEVPSDVMLAIDLSGSINDDGGVPPEPLATVLRAAEGFTNRLRPGDQVGLVTFATNATTSSILTTEARRVGALVRGLSVEPREERGSTNTGEGLRESIIELLSARHNPDARKVIVILTDGKANAPEEETAEEYALGMAAAARERGIEVFSIGLGKNVKADFIQAMASRPENGFLAVDRSTLDGIYSTISTALCEDGAAVIDIIPKIDRSR